jgi:undecaprenyl-diphosphatase
VVGPVIRSARRVARVVTPQLRFLWNRLTPGELGLELTTLLAISGVGFYVFVAYAMVLSSDPGATPADDELWRLSGDLHAGWTDDVAKIVTSLGAFPAVATLVVVTAIVLAARRRPAQLAALVGGLLIVYFAVQAAKAGIDRPRPTGSLVDTAGTAYPSGHAAYSTAWVAAALAATWRLGVATRASLLLGSLALTAAIGGSRIYLRAHWFSDVAGGWGLGFGVFAALATIALIVTHIRHNGARDATPTPQQ